MKMTGKRIAALICAVIFGFHLGLALPAMAEEEEILECNGTEAAAEAPAENAAPEEGEAPEAGEDPAEPEGETPAEEPAGATEPDEPAESEKPVEPEAPSAPAEPAEPETPSVPAEPAKPEEPAKPAEPEKPTEPVKPEKPEEPAAPEKPEEPEAPAPAEEPAASAHFESGYIRVKDGTIVWKDPYQAEKAGTLTGQPVVWAVSAKEDEDPEKDWLKITFDTEEARKAESGPLTGFIQAGSTDALTETEIQELTAMREADPAVRKAGTHLLPAVGFEPAEEVNTEEPEEEQPAEEPAEEPDGEPVKEPAEEPAEEPEEEPGGETTEKPAEEPAEEPDEEPVGETTEEPAEDPAEEPAGGPALPVLTEEELEVQGYRKASVIAENGTEVYRAPVTAGEPLPEVPEEPEEEAGEPAADEEAEPADETPESAEDAEQAAAEATDVNTEPEESEEPEHNTVLENGTILWMLPEDDTWGRIQTIPAEEGGTVITGYVRLADMALYLEGAEEAEEPEEEKPAVRSIRLTSSLDGMKVVHPGQEVVLTAELEGFSEDDVYTVQWQASEDGKKFTDVEGADSLTWTYTISRENFGWTWALVLTLEPAEEE